MDQTQQLLLLMLAAVLGILAVLAMISRQRRDKAERTGQSRFAASTEGAKRCPKCAMGNLWTDRTCISCGARLPG